jgi:Uncharacterised nucleotidyltransferase
MNRRLTAMARTLAQDGYQLRAPVVGGSMLPWIRAGDYLVAAPLPMNNLIPGDVVLFERTGELVAHRLIRRVRIEGGDYLVTKGDWMTTEDTPLAPAAVIGKVFAIDRRGRRIRLDRGATGLLMRFTGWVVRRHPWLLSSLRRLWRMAMGVVRGKGAIDGAARARRGLSSPDAAEQPLAVWCHPDPDPEKLAAVLEHWSRARQPERVLAMIRAEGIAPLCGYHIKRRHLEDGSAGHEVVNGLVGDYYRNTAKNLWRLTRLRPLLVSFDRAGVPVLLLKGASLALSVYPEVGLREMSDVDLLIRPEQLSAADALLREAGYRPIDQAAIDLAKPPYEHLTTFDYRDPEGVKPAIHLHWCLINSTVPHADYSRRIDLDGIWARAGRASLDGLSVMELSPGDAVLYLCEHAMRVSHSMSRLIWMADLAWLIHRKGHQVAWNSVERTADQWGICRLVTPPLNFVRNRLDAPIPDHVLSALRVGAPSIGERIFAWCLQRSIRRPGLSYLVHMALRRSLRARARFLIGTVCPPRTTLAQHFFLPGQQAGRWRYLPRLAEIIRSAARLSVTPLVSRKSPR